MSIRTRPLILGALAAAAVLAFAQDSFTMRAKPAAGSNLTVTTASTMKMAFSGMMEQEINSKTTVTQKVGFAAGDSGWTKFDIQTTDVKMEGDSMAAAMGQGPSAEDIAKAVKEVKIAGEFDETGKTRNVAITGLNEGDFSARGIVESDFQALAQLGFMGLNWPKDPVKVGSKWTSEFDFAKILEANSMGFLTNIVGKMPVEFEVLGFEQIDGKTYAKVKSFMDGKVTFDVAQAGSTGNMTVTSVGTTWVDVTDGVQEVAITSSIARG
jgi:hypothetical protein